MNSTIASKTPNSVLCRREAERATVAKASTIRADSATPHDVIIEDLSHAGFSFTSINPIPKGTVIHVGLAGAGRASALVAWREGRRHGCNFVPELTHAQIETAFTNSSDEPATTLFASFNANSKLEDLLMSEVSMMPLPTRLVMLALGCGLGWAAIVAVLRNLPFS